MNQVWNKPNVKGEWDITTENEMVEYTQRHGQATQRVYQHKVKDSRILWQNKGRPSDCLIKKFREEAKNKLTCRQYKRILSNPMKRGIRGIHEDKNNGLMVKKSRGIERSRSEVNPSLRMDLEEKESDEEQIHVSGNNPQSPCEKALNKEEPQSSIEIISISDFSQNVFSNSNKSPKNSSSSSNMFKDERKSPEFSFPVNLKEDMVSSSSYLYG
ncbi:unnamed protein product [Moneuplotes crassus]|uniref:Uncharacterized protein n=1 Tax=Euplotes crassus TaxID=5936 RepID=A0AAD1Y1C0_EUPCR|nr:unnamed protein product [Moneuplotes crassus]